MTEPQPADTGEIEAPVLNIATSIHTDGDGIGRLAELVDQAREPFDLGDGRIGFVVPRDHQVKIFDTEWWGTGPTQRRGEVHVATPRSLATYVNRHGSPATTFWANKRTPGERARGANPQVVAVIDDDTATGDPAWREHRAILNLVHTQDWLDWTGISGKALTQVQLAEFVEDHLANIIEPTGADMLELAQTFEATKGVEFKSATRLSSSERTLVFEETVQAKAGQKGQITVPERMTLRIAPFEGIDSVVLSARFRYRVSGGALTLTVVIDRPEEVIDNTFAVILDDLAQLTEIPAPSDDMLGLDTADDPVPHRLDIYFGDPGPARRSSTRLPDRE